MSSWRQNLQTWLYLQLQHLVLVSSSDARTKLNANTKLQTFFYPMTSKSFPYSNDFMEMSLAQTLPLKSMTDKQTFSPASGVQNLSPYIWHVDRGGLYHFCTSKTYSHQTVLPPWDAENLGKHTPRLNHHKFRTP